MGVTWAVADNLLRATPSASERLALLQRITSLDLPVPGGSGSARYGCAPPKDCLSSYWLGIIARKRTCAGAVGDGCSLLPGCHALHGQWPSIW